jgi:hypothetical protein
MWGPSFLAVFIRKSIICVSSLIKILRPEMYAVATNYMQEVVSDLSLDFKKKLFCPTHKRPEGRAPVWGSEFTSKDAAPQGGGPAETAARLNEKLRDLRDWCLVVPGGILLLFLLGN